MVLPGQARFWTALGYSTQIGSVATSAIIALYSTARTQTCGVDVID